MEPDTSKILFHWGNPPVPFTIRNACEGCFICGAIGSGKSTGSGSTVAGAYLKHGFGGLVLTVKVGEADDWVRYAQAAGRESDLLILRPDDGEHGHRFNFLDYEMTRPGRGNGIMANVVQVLTNALAPSVGSRVSAHDPFWDQALKKLVHCAVETVALAGETLTLRMIADVVLSAPRSAEESRSPAFLERSLCAGLLRRAASRADLPKPNRDDLEHTLSYWSHELPNLDPKTRSIIEASLSGMVDGLLRAPLRELFCTDTTITPEHTYEGAIIVLDIPTVEFGDVGRDAQLLFKTSWMHAVARRPVTESSRPVFLWQDEAQEFLTPDDKKFAAICRDRLAAIVSLSQNLSGFYAAMHAQDARMTTESYVSCMLTQIYHANSDPSTCEYVERLFGREERYRGGGGFSIEGRSPNQENQGTGVRRNFDFRREDRPIVPGSSLRALRRGGEENGRQVDAIISQSGQLVRHTFKQEERQ